MASFAPIRGTRAQIQATPIVDGQFLVETDQGVDNKIYMDEGSTRTIVGGNTVTGVLPELYIYSETGSVVTVEDAGGTSIPTSQVGTDHWICEVPDYGIYNIYSLLDGETTTQSINVDDCMIYTIDDSHFHCNVVVTYPSGVGASCQISGGGETYSAPALNPPDTSYKFVVHGKNTTYTITTNVDGVTKTETVTTGTTLDQTFNVTIPFARVNLTVEAPPITGNITCTDGTTTIVKPVSPNMVFYLPNTGNWEVSGSDGISPTPYVTEFTVYNLTDVLNEELSTAPDGSTVTPIDDIQTWLLCASIRNKTSYSTLADVLNDKETLTRLISNNNAVNYMVRSKTFLNQGLIPTMTSDTAPSGQCFSSTTHDSTYPYYTMNGTLPLSSNASGEYWYSMASPWYLGYEFDNEVRVRHMIFRLSTAGGGVTTTSFSFQYYDNDINDWVTVPNGSFSDVKSNTGFPTWDLYSVDCDVTSNKFRVYNATQPTTTGLEFQVYPWSGEGITENQDAMHYIGARNYASDTLLNDGTWRDAIARSKYFRSVFNVNVPVMDSDTTPQGTAFGGVMTSGYPAYYAFNKIDGSDRSCAYYETTGNFCAIPIPNNTSTGMTDRYIGYEFTTPTVANYARFVYVCRSGNYSINVSAYKVQGYNGTSWEDIVDISSVLARDFSVDEYAQSLMREIWVELNNTTPYSRYRFLIVNAESNDKNWISINPSLVQFLNRTDVNESEINIYSAANDTLIITPQGGGTALTCITDSEGHGTISRTNLVAGTYTFESSVAKNPSDLSSNYTKSNVVVTSDTIEIFVMPDNVFYWFGYRDIEFEYGSVINGYTQYQGSVPWNVPNDGGYYLDLYSSASPRRFCIVGTRFRVVPPNVYGYAITQGVTMTTDNTYGASPTLRITKAWEVADVYCSVNTTTQSLYKTSTQSTQNDYMQSCVSDNQRHNLYALWYSAT